VLYFPVNGPAVMSRAFEIPPQIAEMAQRRLQRGGPGFGPGLGRGGGPGRGSRPGADPPLFRGVRGQAAFSPVIVDGQRVGLVVVPPFGPLPGLIREYGPGLAGVALGLLIVGTGLAAMVVFRPAHRRLQALEGAARRFGAGDPSARAPEEGGDEIVAVARAFNRMADGLNARAKELREADQARRQLLADVSHELMTPLTAMRGYLETLQMTELKIDEATRSRYVGIVEQETQRLEHTIGDLLDLSRLQAGGGAFNVGEVSVEALFRRVVERHERESRTKGVSFVHTVEPGAEHVLGDGDRLEHALQNLAANALRHSRPGGSIELRAKQTEEGLVLEVRDSGEGVPPDHLEHVFDRFYRVDGSRSGTSGGSGLGLSIVKAIAERHGGRVGARSQPGVETVFEIVLPRPSSSTSADAASGAASATAG
jgi:signal transduction histidine kinase